MSNQKTQNDEVWIFSGSGGQFPGGVFTDLSRARVWIAARKLTGCLTKYPLNMGIYDWALEKGYFKSKSPRDEEAGFIQRFSCASLEHYHFEEGVCSALGDDEGAVGKTRGKK